MEENIRFLKDRIVLAEKVEVYEVCAKLRDILIAIKKKDEQAFINLVFDIDGLSRTSFFDGYNTPEERKERLLLFFGLDSIFEYSLIDGLNYII